MERLVSYTEQAKEAYGNTLAYLAFEFGERTAEKFQSGFARQIQAIIDNPGIRHKIYVDGVGLVHRAIFRSYTHILYIYSDVEINILAIVDPRSDWQGSNPPA